MAKNGRSIPDDCERTATVALPTATSAGFISGDLGSSAALDAFSTMYELPLKRFENRQTNRRTRTITIPRYALRPREVKMRSHPHSYFPVYGISACLSMLKPPEWSEFELCSTFQWGVVSAERNVIPNGPIDDKNKNIFETYFLNTLAG